jgi:non-ribosomal peptide synthetase component F/acyl carrier protein
MPPEPPDAWRDGPLPLSAAQEGLWWLRRGGPGEPGFSRAGFTLGQALRVRLADLDLGALERALEAVAARQEALRMCFTERDGAPVQAPGPVGEVGLEDLGRAAGPSEAAGLAAAFAERPFDVWRGPLWRAGLIRLGGHERVLVLAADALVCDDWSLRLWVTELGLAYRAIAAGRGSPLPLPPVGYGDAVRRQREAAASGALAAQVGYWHERLAGGAPLELLCDRVRPVVESGRGGTHAFVVPRGVVAGLRALAARERATLFTVLLAAFQVLLARHSGQDDVAVGSPAPGRSRPELAGLIGQFEYPLVLRTDLSGDPSFVTLLGRAREVVAGAISHQDIPFEVLLGELARADAAPRHPLFQVVFTLVGGQERAEMAWPGAVALPPAWTTSRWDLSLQLVERGRELEGSLRYSTDLFDPGTTGRLVERYLVLLDSIAGDPAQPITRLELLGPSEGRRLLAAFNGAGADPTGDRPVREVGLEVGTGIERLLRLVEAPQATAGAVTTGPAGWPTISATLPIHVRSSSITGLPAPVSLGRPTGDVHVHVLDPWMRPVPIGLPGEIYIGGGWAAGGHLQRPGATAERFLPDPFAGTPGARVYRTGALGRFRADGDVELLGRIGDQVRLRGLRLEPAEALTPAEEAVARIWAEVLGGPCQLERVGRDDNFFDLGGDSLLALLIIARMQSELSVDVSMASLLGSPTIAGLARLVEQGEPGELAGPVASGMAVTGPAREGWAPLSEAQEGWWRLRRGVPGGLDRLGFSLGRALRLRAADVGALERALGAVVTQQEALRTRFAERGGAPVQVVDPVEPVMLEDLGAADGPGEAARLAAAFVARPFDLGRGPLWRAGLIGLASGERVLVLAADTLVCDKWSLRLWVTELGLAYRELVAGREADLPGLPVGFGEFARWQREVVASGAFDGQVAYWRERLDGWVPLELPGDRARSAREPWAGAAHAVVVPPPLHGRLRALAARERATVFMVLLAAWQALLARHSGQDDVAVGTLAPGRGRPELERVIGLYENPVVLRTDLSGDPSFVTLLGRVREVVAGALSHADLPFDALLRALAGSGSPPPHPLFQSMFMLVGGNTPAGLEPLKAVEVPLAPATARWDLSLELDETDHELRGWLRYSTELFDPPTTARLAERYLVLLDSVVAHPRQPLTRLLAPR